MAEIVTNRKDRQILVHLHTSGATAPSVDILNEGEIAVSSNISGATFYTLQRTESGLTKVAKFIDEVAVISKIDEKIELEDADVQGRIEALQEQINGLNELTFNGIQADNGNFEVSSDDISVEGISGEAEYILSGVSISEALNSLDAAIRALKNNSANTESLKTELLGTVEEGETPVTIMDVSRALAAAKEALKVNASGDTYVSANATDNGSGVTINVSATETLTSAISKANSSLQGIATGADAGVTVDKDNKLDFTLIKINCGEF